MLMYLHAWFELQKDAVAMKQNVQRKGSITQPSGRNAVATSKVKKATNRQKGAKQKNPGEASHIQLLGKLPYHVIFTSAQVQRNVSLLSNLFLQVNYCHYT